MASVNVLLTCAGRRNYLVQYFQTALRGRGRVFAADVRPDAPAMQEADLALRVPAVHDRSYIDALVSLCRLHRIRLLIPLNDLELPVLAGSRERFLAVGTIPVVSSPEAVRVCFDKWATFEFLCACGLHAPYTCLSVTAARRALADGKLSFPLVVKPRWGTASLAIEYVDDPADLDAAYRIVHSRTAKSIVGSASFDIERSVLVQERLTGHEHGLDVVNDLGGRYRTTFIRRKLAMRAGETDRAVTVEDEELRKVGEVLGRRLGHVGNLDCDVYVAERGPYVLEMNPRFGGGYPFSHLAGADLPSALVAWADGEAVKDHWLRVRPGVLGCKCDRVVEARADAAGEPPASNRRSASAGSLSVLRTCDRQAWTEVLEQSIRHDFYHSAEYHTVAELGGEGAARLFVYQEGEYTVALPLLLRPVNEAPGLESVDGRWLDATSVYGYAGPVASHHDVPGPVVRAFQNAVRAELLEQDVIAAFSRLHPILSQAALLSGFGECANVGCTVSLDLTLDEDLQVARYRPNYRRRLEKLRRSALTCVQDHCYAYLPEFVEMYHETMDRVHADRGYRHDSAYFTRLVTLLGPCMTLFVCLMDGKPVNGGLFGTCNGIVQYHLSGTRGGFLPLSPTTLMLDTVRRWANEQGAHTFHLGGGSGAASDSLFHFKAGFSSHTHSFTLWRLVLSPAAYETCCRDATRGGQRLGPSEFFPAYRSPALRG